jgi:hypothetical protein
MASQEQCCIAKALCNALPLSSDACMQGKQMDVMDSHHHHFSGPYLLHTFVMNA